MLEPDPYIKRWCEFFFFFAFNSAETIMQCSSFRSPYQLHRANCLHERLLLLCRYDSDRIRVRVRPVCLHTAIHIIIIFSQSSLSFDSHFILDFSTAAAAPHLILLVHAECHDAHNHIIHPNYKLAACVRLGFAHALAYANTQTHEK